MEIDIKVLGEIMGGVCGSLLRAYTLRSLKGHFRLVSYLEALRTLDSAPPAKASTCGLGSKRLN
jgi:hypothetical protein